jgi:hypothetical protein
MNAEQTARTTNITNESTSSDDVIMVTKASWYKEASGVVAVLGWLSLIFLWTHALLTNGQLEQWYYLLPVVTVSLTASMFRQNSFKVDLKKVTL